METFANGLMGGFEFGKNIRETYNKGALSGRTAAIQGLQVQEDVGPDGKPIYRYGDQVYTQKPEDGLLAAQRQQMMGQAQSQYGDADKAMLYDEEAIKTRKGFIDDLVKRAFAVGTPEALQSAYALINTGERTELRYDDDGGIQLWSHPYDAPDKAAMAFSAPSASDFVKQLANQYTPDVVDNWSKMSLESDRIRADIAQSEASVRGSDQSVLASQQSVRNSQLDNSMKRRGMMGLPNDALERLSILTAERKAANESVALAVKTGDEETLKQALRHRDSIENQVRSIEAQASQGGGGGDGAAPTGLLHSESSGRWAAENDAMGSGGKRGHYGRAQFGHARMSEAKKALGVEFTPKEFMNNPELQQQVEAWHFSDIRKFIRDKGLDRYLGQTHKGVKNLSMDAMVSVAHLGGKKGLQNWLTDPNYDRSDGSNTLTDYARKHNSGDSAGGGGGLVPQGEPTGAAVDPYTVQAQGLLRKAPEDTGLKMTATDYKDIRAEVQAELDDSDEYDKASAVRKQQMFEAKMQQVIALRQQVNAMATRNGGAAMPDSSDAMLQLAIGASPSLFGASE